MDQALLWTVLGSAAGVAAVGVGLWQGWLQLADRRHRAEVGPMSVAGGGVIGASVAVPTGRLPLEVRGREVLLNELRKHRRRGGLVVLAGMGGVGKSTVAAELARQSRTRFASRTRAVWWVSGADATSLSAGLVTVARHSGASEADVKAISGQAPDGPDRLWKLLERGGRGWLLLVDNADEPRLLGAPMLLPPGLMTRPPHERWTSVADGTGWVRPGQRGLVVVTSRQADPATWGRRAMVYRMGPLSDAEAAHVLLDLAPQAGDQIQAEALARRLGGLPLALHLAGSYLGSGIAGRSSFTSYQRALDQGPEAASLLTPDPDVVRADDPRATVMRTWELSLDDLARRELPHARALLRLLSCFAPAIPLPLDLLESNQLIDLLRPAPGGSALMIYQAETRLEQALRGLVRLGLIDTLAGQRAVIVHPLIADTNRAHLLASTDRDPSPILVWHTAIRLMGAAIERREAEQPDNWPWFRQLTPHLHALLDTAAAHVDAEHLSLMLRSTAHLIQSHHSSGSIATATNLTRAALVHELRLGKDDRTILVLRHHLAYQSERQGHWATAEAAFRELLDAQRRLLGDNHPDTLTTRHGIAWTMAEQGKWAEAEAVYHEVLDARRRVLGDEHWQTAKTRKDIAWTAANQGRWRDSENIFRESCAAMARMLGDEHPETLASRHELAWAIANQGRLPEAEAAYQEVLAAQQRVLGSHHPSTLTTRHKLARVVANQGRWMEAEIAYREVLVHRQRLLGDDHPYTLASYHDLAWTVARQGRSAEAATAFREVLSARCRVLGEDHPDTLATRRALSELD